MNLKWLPSLTALCRHYSGPGGVPATPVPSVPHLPPTGAGCWHTSYHEEDQPLPQPCRGADWLPLPHCLPPAQPALPVRRRFLPAELAHCDQVGRGRLGVGGSCSWSFRTVGPRLSSLSLHHMEGLSLGRSALYSQTAPPPYLHPVKYTKLKKLLQVVMPRVWRIPFFDRIWIQNIIRFSEITKYRIPNTIRYWENTNTKYE